MSSGLLGRNVARLQAAVLITKRRCYRAIFLPADGEPNIESERVLGDLRRFCRAQASTFDPDPYVAARMAGRREVWLRLRHFLDLSDEQVAKFVEVESEQYS